MGGEPLHLRAPVFTGSLLLPPHTHTHKVWCILVVGKGKEIDLQTSFYQACQGLRDASDPSIMVSTEHSQRSSHPQDGEETEQIT